ncbi:hypothetical protein AALA79_01945 [Lachnospiraceae bacterium 64-25]
MKKNIFNKENLIMVVIIPILISAIWEKFLSPFLDFVMDKFLFVFNKIFTNFSNNIYKEISYGVIDKYSPIIFSIIMGCLCAYALVTTSEAHRLYKKSIQKFVYKKSSNDTYEAFDESEYSFVIQKSKFFYRFTIFIAIIAHIFTFFYLAKNAYIRENSLKLTCNIEIVSPYVSDSEYKQLKSSFHSMQSRSDYEELVDTLKAIGEKYELNLK